MNKILMMTAPLLIALTAGTSDVSSLDSAAGTSEAAAALSSVSAASPGPLKPWTDYKLIAHEMGGIEGLDYTNSLDAFEQSYAAGFRVFESDLILSSDDRLVARHDWGEYLQPELPDDLKDAAISDEDFMQYPIYDKFKPMDLDQIFSLMKSHPDMYLVTDTKETDPDLIAQQFTVLLDTARKADPELLERIIPEIYTPEMQDIVMNLYPFANEIYSTYLTEQTPDEIVQYAVDQGIQVVGMQTDQVTEDFLQALADHGITPYIYTVNDTDELQQDEAWGAKGFYTDFLKPSDLENLPAAPTEE